jgi:hypothetical protein
MKFEDDLYVAVYFVVVDPEPEAGFHAGMYVYVVDSQTDVKLGLYLWRKLEMMLNFGLVIMFGLTLRIDRVVVRIGVEFQVDVEVRVDVVVDMGVEIPVGV